MIFFFCLKNIIRKLFRMYGHLNGSHPGTPNSSLALVYGGTVFLEVTLYSVGHTAGIFELN